MFEARLSRLFKQWKGRVQSRGLLREAQAALDCISASSDVLIGPNFSTRGGVRNHMLAISQYSELQIGLFPSESGLNKLVQNDTLKDFQHIVNQIDIGEVSAIHTHVDPHMVDLVASSPHSVPWIHTYHTLYFNEHYPSGLANWQAQINEALVNQARNADVRVSVSRWLQDYLRKEHAIETIYIPNGFDVGACDRSNPLRFKEAYGDDDFVLFAAEMNHLKNPAAFVRLADAYPDMKFIMIGRGSSADYVRRLGLEMPRNLVCLDHLRHDEVLDAIAACTCFVATSKNEGLPTVLMEAMAMGKPVVAPNTNGCSELIDEGQFGYMYEFGSDSDLVQQTGRALSDSRVAGPARERARKQFAWPVVIKELDQVYRSQLNRSRQ